MNDAFWKVGELAKMTGTTVRTLHHYEEVGLLSPSYRSESGHRVYGENDVIRLQHSFPQAIRIPFGRDQRMLGGQEIRSVGSCSDASFAHRERTRKSFPTLLSFDSTRKRPRDSTSGEKRTNSEPSVPVGRLK